MKNFIQEGQNLPVVVSHPLTPASGDAVRFGNLTGVAIADEGAGGVGATETMVAFGFGVYDLNVKPIDDNGNSAIAAGDSIYFVDGDDPHLSKKASGYFFGYALEANAAVDGTAAVIEVLHCPPPGAGTTPGDGTVTAAKLGALACETAKINDLAVTTAKLADGAATSAKLDEKTIRYAEVAVTNAQIKGLRAAPKELVAAPGAGKTLEFISAVLLLDYGTNVLTRPNADEDMIVKYGDGAGKAASEASIATFPVHNADAVTTLQPVASALWTAAETTNKALVLHNDGTAEFGGNAGNDTLLRVKVAYRVHTNGF